MQQEKLPYLNLGCGKRIDHRWLNVDMAPTEPGVQVYDLTKPLPLDAGSFEVVYHSHVLEHIPKDSAQPFIKECFRLLGAGGILRIALPDLEVIARNYIKFLDENIKQPTEETEANYDWTMIEMYDQVVRGESGGEMIKYLQKKDIPNWDYIESRSAEARRIAINDIPPTSFQHKWNKFKQLEFKTKLILVKGALKNWIFTTIMPGKKYYKAGAFRLGGEVHQWMYDRYSLAKLLKECGFKTVEVKTAFTSNIPNWESFELDAENGKVLKPDSLFMEAIK